MKKGILPGILLGPSFHLGYLIYIFGRNILSLATYAEMSLAMPISFLILLATILLLPLRQLHKRSAHLALFLIAIAYIIVAIGMPFIPGIFNIGRLVVMTPWLVQLSTSVIWVFLSYVGVICYGCTAICLLITELKPELNPMTDPKAKNAIQREQKHHRVRYRGTLAFFITIVVAAMLITGNSMWYRQTYTLRYDPAIDMAIEYWIGADEQSVNALFPMSNSTPIAIGSEVIIDLTNIITEQDPLYAAKFLVDNTTDVYFGYNSWYSVTGDFSALLLQNISNSLALRLIDAYNDGSVLNLTCIGYRESKLEALQATHATIVLAGGLGAYVPRTYANNHPEFNATCWLYSKWGMKIQAPHGCGIGFLLDYEMLRDELLDWQDTRINGPDYYRQVIEGAMYNVEKIDIGTRRPLIEAYVREHLGMNTTYEKGYFGEWYWAFNALLEAQYFEQLAKWNELIDGLYNNITWPNGTVDESIRFKLINCGIPENLIDYFDNDPDYACYYNNLGYGTHWAVDGYMFYRSSDEPYWTYGYLKLLANKPKIVPHEERLVLLGCMHTNPYRYDFSIEKGSRFRHPGGEWTTDVNDDGLSNGFDVLMLDIMMCGAEGIRRVNLWPGPGPRSTCCDYREYSRDLIRDGDFHIEMASVLNQTWDIQFQFAPGSEHFWDKELVDITMDLLRPKGLIILALTGGIFAVLLAMQIKYLKKLEVIEKNKSKPPN
jgi:hypothetical protein